MRNSLTWRWLAGLGAVAALIATAAPATAAPSPGTELYLYFPNTTVALEHPGKVEMPIIGADVELALNQAKVTYDLSGLGGRVTITEDGESGWCTPDGTKLVCEASHPIYVDEWGSGTYFAVRIAATEAAEDGDNGLLNIRFEANGVQAISYQATIRVGEGVDLAAGPNVALTSKPGGSITAPFHLANIGAKTVNGLVALFDSSYAFKTSKKFENCLYYEDFLIACQFHQSIAPGEEYTLSLPYTIRPTTWAPSMQEMLAFWLTPSDFDDFVGAFAMDVRKARASGTAGKLSLTKVPQNQISVQGAQTDIDLENNWSTLSVKVTGDNQADLAAVGASLTGAAGDVVTAMVGLVNHGPAVVDATRGGGSATNVLVKVPTGTTAVGVPLECYPSDSPDWNWDEAGKPGAAAYRCLTLSFFEVKETQTYEFEFQIDKVIPNAAGSIAINIKCQCEGLQRDLDAANDKAKILVNAGGGGGGLPVTGTATGIIAAVGGALVVAGVAGFLLVRRRRMRFVA